MRDLLICYGIPTGYTQFEKPPSCVVQSNFERAQQLPTSGKLLVNAAGEWRVFLSNTSSQLWQVKTLRKNCVDNCFSCCYVWWSWKNWKKLVFCSYENLISNWKIYNRDNSYLSLAWIVYPLYLLLFPYHNLLMAYISIIKLWLPIPLPTRRQFYGTK